MSLPAAFAHLCTQVDAITPPAAMVGPSGAGLTRRYRCTYGGMPGTRPDLADRGGARHAEWRVGVYSRRVNTAGGRLEATVFLDVYYDADRDPAAMELFLEAEARAIEAPLLLPSAWGVKATTTIRAIRVADQAPTSRAVTVAGRDQPRGYILRIPFLILHGSC